MTFRRSEWRGELLLAIEIRFLDRRVQGLKRKLPNWHAAGVTGLGIQ
jgi:hypothetical protein